MRIVSWNVNGLRAVAKKGFEPWVQAEGPDVLCLQETKANPDQLEKNLTELPGYTAHFRSAKKKGYSGVVTYSKTEPLRVTSMDIVEFDDEGRVVATAFPGVTVVNAYFPNSQEERARLPYKLRFCEAMTAFCNDLVQKGENVVPVRGLQHRPYGNRPSQTEAERGQPRLLHRGTPSDDRVLVQRLRGHLPAFREGTGALLLVELSRRRTGPKRRLENRLPLRERGACSGACRCGDPPGCAGLGPLPGGGDAE